MARHCNTVSAFTMFTTFTFKTYTKGSMAEISPLHFDSLATEDLARARLLVPLVTMNGRPVNCIIFMNYLWT